MIILGTVNALAQPTLDLYNAYINLKNDVYSNLIQISIPGPNDTVSYVLVGYHFFFYGTKNRTNLTILGNKNKDKS